jgi:hypothetical protein
MGGLQPGVSRDPSPGQAEHSLTSLPPGALGIDLRYSTQFHGSLRWYVQDFLM